MVLVGMLFSCKECYCGNSGLIKKTAEYWHTHLWNAFTILLINRISIILTWIILYSQPLLSYEFSDILVDLMINSREFQYEILPAIVKSYRNAQSSEKFKYTKVQSVHNRDLLKLVSLKTGHNCREFKNFTNCFKT